MADEGDVWCTIESDPGVFTELIETVGVTDVEVQELYALDVDEMRKLAPLHGLIFLFKWKQERDDRPVLDVDETLSAGVFFANQIVTNACATQALLAILLNCDESVDIGQELRDFKSFTSEFPPDVKGLAISNQPSIRKAHNSFRKPDSSFVFEKQKPDSSSDDDDLFHFISYVPVNGVIFEIDGLKRGPVRLDTVPEGADWLDVVRPHIQRRIDRYSADEIRFNLMAMTRSRLATLNAQRDALVSQLGASGGGGGADDDGDDEQQPSGGSSSSAAIAADDDDEEAANDAALRAEIASVERAIADEQDKRKRWRLENVRRRHDYIPFIIQTLMCLAEKNRLQSLVDRQQQ
jgi:ubiquitin carboxyl-terminal hydrolase L5